MRAFWRRTALTQCRIYYSRNIFQRAVSNAHFVTCSAKQSTCNPGRNTAFNPGTEHLQSMIFQMTAYGSRLKQAYLYQRFSCIFCVNAITNAVMRSIDAHSFSCFALNHADRFFTKLSMIAGQLCHVTYCGRMSSDTIGCLYSFAVVTYEKKRSVILYFCYSYDSFRRQYQTVHQ